MQSVKEARFHRAVPDPRTGREVKALLASPDLEMWRDGDNIVVAGKTGECMLYCVHMSNVYMHRLMSSEMTAVSAKLAADDEPPPTTPSGKMPTAQPAKRPRKGQSRVA